MAEDGIPLLVYENLDFTLSEHSVGEMPDFTIPSPFNGIAIVCFSDSVMKENELATLQNTIKWLTLTYSECLIVFYNKHQFPLTGWQKTGVKKMIIFGKEAVADLQNIAIAANSPLHIGGTDIIVGEKLENLPKISAEEKKQFAGAIKMMLKN